MWRQGLNHYEKSPQGDSEMEMKGLREGWMGVKGVMARERILFRCPYLSSLSTSNPRL
jgi:hypothetical protein